LILLGEKAKSINNFIHPQMKEKTMIKKITGVMVILMLLSMGLTQAQTNKTLFKKLPNKVVAGNEMGNPGVIRIPQTTKPNYKVLPRMAGTLSFSFVETGVFTGYDVVSNGTSQQIWVDPVDPTQVHAVEMWSPQDAGWTTRNILYFYSFDGGDTWTQTSILPDSSGVHNRSGYPTIDGYPDETPLVGMHTFRAGENATNYTRGIFWRDDSPGAGTFSQMFDPGVGPDGPGSSTSLIWPRNAVIDNDNFVIAESENNNPNDDSMHVNFYNSTNGFSGWQSMPGDQAETYSLAVSEDGSTVGLLFIGNASYPGDVIYTQTTDLGASWTDPLVVYDWATSTDSLYCLRGLDLIFLGDLPCAVFELAYGDPVGGTYTIGPPSKIAFWNGNMTTPNNYVVIADSATINYNDTLYESTNDVFVPLCRPSIGRSSRGGALFVSFNATTPYYLEAGASANNYYACWFTSSFDSGATWNAPVQFTQDTVNGHMMDWRFPSLAPVNYVPANDSVCTVQMVVQSDTIPGSTFSAPAGYPVAVSAEMQGVRTMVTIPSLIVPPNDVKQNPKSPYTFTLQQNYPNPFNPSTNIKYSIAKRSNVTLKIFDMLGREVKTLVNSSQEPGNYTINFDASKLASGMYIYKLAAGSFTSAKKMILLK
jgi:Secretion system C-terminal sorting domain